MSSNIFWGEGVCWLNTETMGSGYCRMRNGALILTILTQLLVGQRQIHLHSQAGKFRFKVQINGLRMGGWLKVLAMTLMGS